MAKFLGIADPVRNIITVPNQENGARKSLFVKGYRPAGQRGDWPSLLGAVTFGGTGTRMSIQDNGLEALPENSTPRRDSNDSRDQGRVGICGVGRAISDASAGERTRQDEAGHNEARRNHEARQDARRQDDARGHGEDFAYG